MPELAGWTPVAITPGPDGLAIDWGDLGELRFDEPFFDQTIERWAGGSPPPRLRRTGIAALDEIDAAGIAPTALIFHLSRCGSTLLSRLLGGVPDSLVLSEPQPINGLLLGAPDIGAEALPRLLRRLVAGLAGRSGARHLFLKLSSWNIIFLAAFRSAFPGVPVIWLQRRPEAVLASLLARPAGWMGLQRQPLQAQALFGIPPEETAGLSPADFTARALAALLTAAQDVATAEPRLVLDYDALPDAAWDRVAPFVGIPADAAMTDRLQKIALYDAKEPGRLFAARTFPGEATVPAACLAPLYEALRGESTVANGWR